MAAELQMGSPGADALQNTVQNKLMELGWTSGGLDDTSLAEYIVLMLANGKTEQEVSSELVQDLLTDVSTEDTTAADFSRWLFQQLAVLNGQPTGPEETQQYQSEHQMSEQQDPIPGGYDRNDEEDMAVDEDMNDSAGAQSDGSIPTGPKSMRNGKQRDKRMLGHMNRAMDRSTDNQVLHRIKGAAGRINTHNREPPKGPAPKGPRATMQRLGNATPQRQMAQQMQQMGPNNPNNPMSQMTPQQQMQLMALYEQQAKMMAQIFNPGQQQSQQQQPPVGGFNPNNRNQSKSLFDRVENNKQRGPRPQPNNGNNSEMPSADSSMEVEPGSQQASGKQDPTMTTCRFNLSCTRADCPFVHQSPAAPPGTAIDMTDTCSFKAHCTNRKCTARHPSPAQLGPHGPALSHHTNGYSSNTLSSAAPLGSNPHDTRPDCKFFPHCTNPACPFKHPSMPPCRNGADCTTPGCKFFHNTTPCKFDPCLNPSCPYKHAEGQKRGNYRDKVWINPSSSEAGDQGQHVSERRFVEGEGEEELIKPEANGEAQMEDGEGAGAPVEAAQPDGIIT